jgi:transcriptional regulator
MYPPVYFVVNDAEVLQQFLQQHYFGLLFSSSAGLQYSPLPFLFDWQSQPAKAYCHLARNNPQLGALEQGEVTILIQGPHAFVAADCYVQQPAVSTWNYTLVELKGQARLMDASQTLALARRQEADSAPQMLQAADYQQKLVQGIVGVEISLHSISGRFKLSQNKAVEQQQAVIRYLQQTEQKTTVWQLMQQHVDQLYKPCADTLIAKIPG